MLRSSLATLALAILSSAAHAARSPAEAVQGFYAARIQSGSVGVPTGAELAKFSTFLTPEVVCLLGASLRYNEKFSKAKPLDKAPLAEGDLYSGAADAPTRFTAEAPEVSGGKGRVRVQFYRDAQGAAEPVVWEDVVHVAQVRGKWLISDVEYAEGVPGGKHGSLVQSLRTVLSSPDPAVGWNARELGACTLGPQPTAAKAARATGSKKGSARKGAVKKGASKKGASKKGATTAKHASGTSKAAHKAPVKKAVHK